MTGTRWRRVAVGLVAGLVATLAVSGCSAGTSDRASSSSGGNQKTAAGQADTAAEAPNNAGGAAQGGAAPPGAAPPGAAPGGKPAQGPGKVVPDERAIIYTGTITVQVSNVNERANQAGDIATRARGFVGGDNRTVNGSREEARLLLRVPAEQFGSVLTALAALGTELNRSVSTEDVSEQIADVNSRVATAQASVDRVRALLGRAATITEIVALEGEVARRESDLESLKARQRKLSDLTALSTITVVLVDKDKPAREKKPQTGFLAGLGSGWKSFTASMTALLTVLGALLPWLLVLGPLGALMFWLVRRNAGRRAAAPLFAPQAVPATQPAAPPADRG